MHYSADSQASCAENEERTLPRDAGSQAKDHYTQAEWYVIVSSRVN